MERTLVTSKGKEVTTILTDAEAKAIAAKLPSDFAQSITTQANPTPDQITWMHILAVQELTKGQSPAQTPVNIGNCASILALFEAAKQHLKNPKINFLSGDCPIRLKISKNEKYTGQIFVDNAGSWDANVYYGRIDCEGNFLQTRNCPEGVDKYLQTFAANPAEEAARQGKLTGTCVFCNRPLSDERSTEIGYGAKCASTYNLPYPGKKTAKKITPVKEAYWDEDLEVFTAVHADGTKTVMQNNRGMTDSPEYLKLIAAIEAK